jgi:hypothetical protein
MLAPSSSTQDEALEAHEAHERKLQQERLRYWRVQEPLFAQISKMGWQRYVDSLPHAKNAFQLSDRDVRCIDERTPGGIHLAGSGILIQDQAEEILRSAGATGIWSHAECGAARMAGQELRCEESLPAGRHGAVPSLRGLFDVDSIAKEWAMAIADRLRVPYKGHIPQELLKGPAAFHIARVIYVDDTGVFDPSKHHGFPPGFVISRKYLPPEYARKEVEIAISIAFGAHGFKDLLTSENPLQIVLIADPSEKNAQSSAFDDLRHERVFVNGFVAPMEK